MLKKLFLKPAQEIYLKVQKGIYDVSNEQYGIKVGISSSQSTTNIVNPAGNQQKNLLVVIFFEIILQLLHNRIEKKKK